jgi:hypothetical protein
MGLFERFKRRPAEAPPSRAPGPGEQMVVFTDLGMH